MATSEVQICNSALIKLGAARIISLEDDSREARICKEQYPKIRDHLLRSHPWNFSLKRATLSKLATDPEFEFESQFQLPSDCMRIETTNLNTNEAWSVEGDKLLANVSTIKILYRAKIVNVTLMDENFVEVLALGLAADISYALVQRASLTEQLFNLYEKALKDARSLDAQEGNFNRRIVAETFINARY